MPEPTTDQDEPTAARKKPAPAPDNTPEPAPATAVTDTVDQSAFEPYPGAHFFYGGRHSRIFTALGHRLAREGCTDGRPLGPDWTNAHRDAFAVWQRTLRPKGAGDVSGIPDETAWDRLRVPRVTPLPKEP